MVRKTPLAFVLFAFALACESDDLPCIHKPILKDCPVCEETSLEITVPVATGLNPASAPPISTYRWRTADGFANPDSVRWILVSLLDHGFDWDDALDYIRDNSDAPEWRPWVAYDSTAQTGTSWTTPPLSFQDGLLVFAVHGKMACGVAKQEFDLDRNARRVRIPSDIYPRLRLTSGFTDPIESAIVNTPTTYVDLSAGTPVEFCWTAHPGHDFEDAMVYRYGWDILDLDDDSQWEVVFTPFDGCEACSPTRTFPPGTNTFHVEMRNGSGFIVRIPVSINFTPVVK